MLAIAIHHLCTVSRHLVKIDCRRLIRNFDDLSAFASAIRCHPCLTNYNISCPDNHYRLRNLVAVHRCRHNYRCRKLNRTRQLDCIEYDLVSEILSLD